MSNDGKKAGKSVCLNVQQENRHTARMWDKRRKETLVLHNLTRAEYSIILIIIFFLIFINLNRDFFGCFHKKIPPLLFSPDTIDIERTGVIK
ncbi:hypothetical protein CR161_10390 [Prosthecochloris sp. ZM]|nr:hypothetical protein CR161_10390 [Prosthecochloris sp. ZM]